MNPRKHLLILFGLALVLVATSAMAAQKGKKTTMTLTETASIGGTTLPAGDYQVTWQGNDAHVQVTVMRGKKVVATTAATIAPRTSAPNETVLVTAHKGETVNIVEIRPEGIKEALLLEQ